MRMRIPLGAAMVLAMLTTSFTPLDARQDARAAIEAANKQFVA